MTQWVDTGPGLSFNRRVSFITLLKQAAAQHPDDTTLQRRLAQTLTATGADDAAIETWRRVVEASPDDEWAWRELGRLLLRTRQAPQALEAFEHLVTLTPQKADSYIWLERALQTIGSQDAACPQYSNPLLSR